MHRHLLAWLGGAALALPGVAAAQTPTTTTSWARSPSPARAWNGISPICPAPPRWWTRPGCRPASRACSWTKASTGCPACTCRTATTSPRAAAFQPRLRRPGAVRGTWFTPERGRFPETLPDGQSQVDAIDLDGLESITVLRGPSSVLYGNATGGVVDMTTRTGRDLEYDQRVSVAGGEDGYRKARLELGGADRDGHHYLSLTGVRHDGQRQQSDMEKYLLNARVGRARPRTGIWSCSSPPWIPRRPRTRAA